MIPVMRELSTDIEIAAPAARVWRHLTDFAAYPEWIRSSGAPRARSGPARA